MHLWNVMKVNFGKSSSYELFPKSNFKVYVPKTRTDLGVPQEKPGQTIDYDEILGDTPLYTLYMLVRQQLLAFPAYLRE
jgi:hypothetical protein